MTRVGSPTREGKPGATSDSRQGQRPHRTQTRRAEQVWWQWREPAALWSPGQSAVMQQVSGKSHSVGYVARSSVSTRAWARTRGKGLTWAAAPEPMGLGAQVEAPDGTPYSLSYNSAVFTEVWSMVTSDTIPKQPGNSNSSAPGCWSAKSCSWKTKAFVFCRGWSRVPKPHSFMVSILTQTDGIASQIISRAFPPQLLKGKASLELGMGAEYLLSTLWSSGWSPLWFPQCLPN